MPCFCLRHDVDALLWQPHCSRQDDMWEHIATFNALGRKPAPQECFQSAQVVGISDESCSVSFEPGLLVNWLMLRFGCLCSVTGVKVLKYKDEPVITVARKITQNGRGSGSITIWIFLMRWIKYWLKIHYHQGLWHCRNLFKSLQSNFLKHYTAAVQGYRFLMRRHNSLNLSAKEARPGGTYLHSHHLDEWSRSVMPASYTARVWLKIQTTVKTRGSSNCRLHFNWFLCWKPYYVGGLLYELATIITLLDAYFKLAA